MDTREYSDMLFDLIEEGAVDAEEIAKDLIYWCSEDDIKKFMQIRDLLPDEEEEENPDDEIEDSPLWKSMFSDVKMPF